jgi:uncharacterized damage-inducible protein DinB
MTIARSDPQPHADERTTLREFLEYYRATLLLKADGLNEQQARQRLGPSEMTLLGLVRHMVEVERAWFRRRLSGEDIGYEYCDDEDRDRDFHPGPDDTLAEAVATFRAECDRSRTIEADIASLEQQTIAGIEGYDGEPVSLRWVLVHMIEEYARHAGHADLIRESIDGAVGD